MELHGTGTKVGDLCETSSIGNILGKNKNQIENWIIKTKYRSFRSFIWISINTKSLSYNEK